MVMKLLVAAAVSAAAVVGPARADEPDAITRQIGLDMLRRLMLERCSTPVDWQPPGYFLVGYDVRVG